MNGDGGVVYGSHYRGESWAPSMVTVFIPPTIFAEVQTVLDSPMIPDMPEDVVWRDGVWIKTGDKVAFVIQYDGSVVSDQLTINSHRDFTIGQFECFSNVVSVV